MGKYFLVDYENVHEDGLRGIEDLGSDDCIDIFYTLNANKISFDFVKHFMSNDFKSKLIFHETKAGKQSLDFQLSAHLGLLAGTEGNKYQYYIVSKDKGFLNVVEFVNEIGLIDVKLQNSMIIKDKSTLEDKKGHASLQLEKTQESKEIDNLSKIDMDIDVSNELSNEKQENVDDLETEIVKESVESEEVVLSKVEDQPVNTENNEEALANEIVVEKKKEKKLTKKRSKKTDSTKAKLSPEESMALNKSIQQILSQAKFESKVISHAASFIGKHVKDVHAKNVIYQDFIKTFGRKKGIEVYNAIKEFITGGNVTNENEIEE